eukprot:1480796-Prorocentrum_lima.AAC.1
MTSSLVGSEMCIRDSALRAAGMSQMSARTCSLQRIAPCSTCVPDAVCDCSGKKFAIKCVAAPPVK